MNYEESYRQGRNGGPRDPWRHDAAAWQAGNEAWHQDQRLVRQQPQRSSVPGGRVVTVSPGILKTQTIILTVVSILLLGLFLGLLELAKMSTVPVVQRSTVTRNWMPMPHREAVASVSFEGNGQLFMVAGVSQGDPLSSRSQPGLTSPIVGKLPNGSGPIQIVGGAVTKGESLWVPVRINGQEGWVARAYLRRLKAKPV
jgi:hypothetical protein